MLANKELTGSKQLRVNALSALHAVQLPIAVRRLAVWLGWLLLCMPILGLLAPWQQFVEGAGNVSAFSPVDREQSIDAPIGGRITRWHVLEGATVKSGDPLVEINDIDPNLPKRLLQQQEAALAKQLALQEQARSYDEQVKNLQTTRDLLVNTSEYRLDMAKARSQSARQSLDSARATASAASLQVQRLRRLHGDGIVSRRDLELAERDDLIARRSVDSAQASLRSAEADQLAAEIDVGRTKADAQARIDSAAATGNKARGELEDTRSSLAKLEVDLARQRSQIVKAPRDGTVFRLYGNPEGKFIKQGDPLLVVVPDTVERSVELWVDGNDVPLITAGRHARLQFEGWPAVQFVGWPSVAVGTFGGTVAFVDATDDGKGKFRVMVVPDEQDHAWPSARFLRQGVRVRGWILLDQVRLGWEVWRQLNGFPQSISMDGTEEDKPKNVARKRLK